MTEEKVSIANSQQENIRGLLQENNKSIVVILCHGFGTDKDSPKIVALSDRLSINKLSTIRFDFYGHGESDGRFEDITLSRAVENVLSVIKYAKDQGYKTIYLVGSSFGGAASILAAAQSIDVARLALISPVSSYKQKEVRKWGLEGLEKWKENGYVYKIKKDGRKLKLNYKFFEDLSKNDGYSAAETIKAPTLIVHGSKDETVLIEQSIKTSKIISDCHLEIIEGADHRYTQEVDYNKMLKLVVDFLT